MDDFAVALAPLLALVSAYSCWLELTVVFGFALAPGTYHLVLPVMHVVSGGIMPIGTYLIVLPVILAEFGGTLGLFVGFSFMVFWDCLEFVLKMSGKIGGLTM